MNNEDGIALKIGDQVWTIGVFECLYTPYRISTEPYTKNNNVYVHIVEEKYFEENDTNFICNTSERMNVYHLSHYHPKNWKFLKE